VDHGAFVEVDGDASAVVELIGVHDAAGARHDHARDLWRVVRGLVGNPDRGNEEDPR
jgi:hypothetical protein